jgi:hypothetical protein
VTQALIDNWRELALLTGLAGVWLLLVWLLYGPKGWGDD